MDHHANDNSDDESSQSSCATFSSDESDPNDYTNLFSDGLSRWCQYVEMNSEHIQEVIIKPYCLGRPDIPIPSPSEWVALGCNIGKNTHLKKVLISTARFDEYDTKDDSDLFSENNMKEFCGGLFKNRSISSLSLCLFRFGIRVNWLESLLPFVIENTELSELRLNGCSISRLDMQLLASAFGRRANPHSIRSIIIRPIAKVTDGSVPYIVEMANHCTTWKHFV